MRVHACIDVRSGGIDTNDLLRTRERKQTQINKIC